MRFSLVIGTTFALGAFALVSPAFAQDGAAIAKERGGIMRTVSDAVKAMSSSAEAGKVGANDAAIAAKAAAAYGRYTSLFPAGTDSTKIKTRAKPEIWKDKTKFEAEAAKLMAALNDAEKAAKAGDAKAFGAAVKSAQVTCNDCHKPFRGAKPK